MGLSGTKQTLFQTVKAVRQEVGHLDRRKLTSRDGSKLHKLLDEVHTISARLKLRGVVVDRASVICSEAAATQLARREPCSILAAASIYLACREARIPVTLRDLAEVSGSDPRRVGRSYILLMERMRITRPELNGRRYVYHLALKNSPSDEAFRLSEEIIRNAAMKGLGGKNPMTLAAAALYLACHTVGEDVTQAELAVAAGVEEESVRECCKSIRTVAFPPTSRSRLHKRHRSIPAASTSAML